MWALRQGRSQGNDQVRDRRGCRKQAVQLASVQCSQCAVRRTLCTHRSSRTARLLRPHRIPLFFYIFFYIFATFRSCCNNGIIFAASPGGFRTSREQDV
jgi:hypothetical protein